MGGWMAFRFQRDRVEACMRRDVDTAGRTGAALRGGLDPAGHTGVSAAGSWDSTLVSSYKLGDSGNFSGTFRSYVSGDGRWVAFGMASNNILPVSSATSTTRPTCSSTTGSRARRGSCPVSPAATA